DGRRAIALGDGASGELVEERLEQVVVGPVDQRHVDMRAPELVRRGQPSEPAADDDHPAPGGAHAWISSKRSARMIRAAASISARCEKAWGKLPRCRPVSASSSSA